MMTHAASRRVAIWIDHHEAILLVFEVDPSNSSGPHGSAEDWPQHHVDAEQYPLMQQYYDAVLFYLEPNDEILILGPGQAKHELCQWIEQHRSMRGKVVGLYDASRLAEIELVFPTGEVWRAKEAGLVKGKLKASFRSA